MSDTLKLILSCVFAYLLGSLSGVQRSPTAQICIPSEAKVPAPAMSSGRWAGNTD